MIVGKVFFQTRQLQFPLQGGIEYGPFLPPEQATALTPFFYFSAPVLLRPTPIITFLPFDEVRSSWQCDLYDFSAYRPGPTAPEEWSDDLSAEAMLPYCAVRLHDPPKWIEVILDRAQHYWLEFTSRPDASQLWEQFRTLPLVQRDELIGRRAKKATKFLRENLFICIRWPEWQQFADQRGFPTWAEDCAQNGIPITVESLKKRARRLGLGTRREMLV